MGNFSKIYLRIYLHPVPIVATKLKILLSLNALFVAVYTVGGADHSVGTSKPHFNRFFLAKILIYKIVEK